MSNSVATPFPFSRLYGGPLDNDSVFDTYEDFQAYMASGRAYAGQSCWVTMADDGLGLPEQSALFVITNPSEGKAQRVAPDGISEDSSLQSISRFDGTITIDETVDTNWNEYGAIKLPGDVKSSIDTARADAGGDPIYLTFHDGMRHDDPEYHSSNNNQDTFNSEIIAEEYDADLDETTVWFADVGRAFEREYFYDHRDYEYASINRLDYPNRVVYHEIQDYRDDVNAWVNRAKQTSMKALVYEGDATDTISTETSIIFDFDGEERTITPASVTLNEDGDTEIELPAGSGGGSFTYLPNMPAGSISAEYMGGDSVSSAQSVAMGVGASAQSSRAMSVGQGTLAQDEGEVVLGASNARRPLRNRSYTDPKARIFTLGIPFPGSFGGGAVARDAMYATRGEGLLRLATGVRFDGQEITDPNQIYDRFGRVSGNVIIEGASFYGEPPQTYKVPLKQLTPPPITSSGEAPVQTGIMSYEEDNGKFYRVNPEIRVVKGSLVLASENSIGEDNVGYDGHHLVMGSGHSMGQSYSCIAVGRNNKLYGNGSHRYAFGADNVFSEVNQCFVVGRGNLLGRIGWRDRYNMPESRLPFPEGIDRYDNRIYFSRNHPELSESDVYDATYLRVYRYSGQSTPDAEYQIVKKENDYSNDWYILHLDGRPESYMGDEGHGSFENLEYQFGKLYGSGTGQAIISTNSAIELGYGQTVFGGAGHVVESADYSTVVGGEDNYVEVNGRYSVVLGGKEGRIKDNARHAVSVAGGTAGISNSLAVLDGITGAKSFPVDLDDSDSSIEAVAYEIGTLDEGGDPGSGYPLKYVDFRVPTDNKEVWTKSGSEDQFQNQTWVVLRMTKYSPYTSTEYRNHKSLVATCRRMESVDPGGYNQAPTVRFHFTKENGDFDYYIPRFSVDGSSHTLVGGPLRTQGGEKSFAQGEGRTHGKYSHAEGAASAHGRYSHAEGRAAAYGDESHAEQNGLALGNYSHASGQGIAHSEGIEAFAGMDSAGLQITRNSWSGYLSDSTFAPDYTEEMLDGRLFDYNGKIRDSNGKFVPGESLVLFEMRIMHQLVTNAQDWSNIRVEKKDIVVARQGWETPVIVHDGAPEVVFEQGADISLVGIQIQTGPQGQIEIYAKKDIVDKGYKVGVTFHATEFAKGNKFRIAPGQDHLFYGWSFRSF